MIIVPLNLHTQIALLRNNYKNNTIVLILMECQVHSVVNIIQIFCDKYYKLV
jgi:hypothetical protein